MSNQNHSSPFPSCFRPTTTTNHHSITEAPPLISGNPDLTTCLYHTDLGLFSLTWSRNLFGRSFHLHLLLDNSSDGNPLSLPSLSSPSFHLHIKPFIFWKKQGSKTLSTAKSKRVQIFWDFSRAKFGSGPDPKSGFYIAVVIDGEMTLLVGDSPGKACAKTKATKPERTQVTIMRREHVYGNKLYTTKARFGGKTRDLSIDFRIGDEPRLCFCVDNKRVLEIKHLKWKFRGNERIEIDGVHVNVSWDVYNWLFDEDGYALFMFRFEKLRVEDEIEDDELGNLKLWSQQSCGFGFGFETKRMKKGLLRTARSSSSSSLSPASSSCSSVMEWASMEENELKGPSGFSLLVYAWKS